MAEKSLEERVAALEAQMLGNNLQEHFRDQAELIDRMFAYRFEEFDKKWDDKLEAKLEPIRSDLGIIKDVLKAILTRLPYQI
jgi:CHASE3 domain sensor protein